MIISNDKTVLYLGVAKTGTVTMQDVLVNYGNNFTRSRHQTFIQIRDRYPDLTDFTAVKVYAMYRDPVERFASAYNYLITKCTGGMYDRFPELFTRMAPPPQLFYKNPADVPAEIQAIAQTITPRMVIESLFQRKWNFDIFSIQCDYWTYCNATILPFSDFDNSAKTIIAAFNGDTSIVIPKLNSADHNVLDNFADADTIDLIKNYYIKDYAFAPDWVPRPAPLTELPIY